MNIQRINLKDVKDFNELKEENLRFAKIYRNEHISISLDKYAPGVKTPFVQKNRPSHGKEILIPLKGKIKIITEDHQEIFDPETDGISIVVVNSNTKRKFENITEEEALVLAIFAPPFLIDELKELLNEVRS